MQQRSFSGSKQVKDAKYKEKVSEEEKQELMAKVGQLTIENDWLKKKSHSSVWTRLREKV